MPATIAAASPAADTLSSTTFFAHERASTSLQDLDIVRKIVEREGCLEALTQLLTTHARASQTQKSMAASATLAAAPMVVQSLLDQLRGVSVQIVESIDKWKRVHRDHEVFQWRSLNYLAKMLRDTDFLALHRATVAQLQAFQGLRLERNPFLSPMHLDHAALREASPDMACRLTLFVGNVDMKRIFAASRLLLQEEQASSTTPAQEDNTLSDTLVGRAESSPAAITTTTTRLHWSHRPIKLALSASSPSLRTESVSADPRDAMAFDVELAKELVFQHEHELGAMKEELAVLQRKLQKDLLIAPDKKRQLQTRVAGLTHDIKLRTGDLFHRRNELQRKEAVLRMDKRRVTRAKEFTKALQKQQPRAHDEMPTASPREGEEAAGPAHFTVTDTFRAALQADELRRQDLVDKFATYTKLQASVSVTKRKLQTLSSPHGAVSLSPWRAVSSRPGSASSPRGRGHATAVFTPIEAMTAAAVETFIASLPLGDDAKHYGALLRAKGIDGRLLVQAESGDLEELGVATRLHRVKILEAVRQLRAMQTERC